MSPRDEARLRELAESGQSNAEIAVDLGVNERTVRRARARLGLEEPATERMTASFIVRCTPEQLEELTASATREGVSRMDLVRRRLFGAESSVQPR